MTLNRQISFLLFFLQFFTIFTISYATTLVIPSSDDVVGEVQYVSSESNESIEEVGIRFDIGFSEMVSANPQVSTHSSLAPNSPLIVPSQFILPNVPRTGIVINLAEYRLYYFPENENVVLTFPVGIGRKGWKTPLGITKVIAKQVNPVWRPTENLRTDAAKHGDPLPEVFPSNPYNPLGKYALRLGWPTFLIHGTNRPNGIGSRVSAGCIRMLPDDIEHLFALIPVGTQVRIINEPIKIGKLDGNLVVQVHPLLSEQRNVTLQSLLQKKLAAFTNTNWLSNKAIQDELASPSGLVKKVN
jgi:L,D-transpeptidase ErfK/SrfK